ncbi:MAG: OmpA family protein [Alphaproteobacteria bacterium]|nr:OmpA family protein [Alphaproteobacteria bacterium]
MSMLRAALFGAALLAAGPASAQQTGELVLVAVDPFGRPVDADWTLEAGDKLAEARSRTSLFLPAGHYSLAVTAEGFFGTTLEVDVIPGQRSEAQAMLDASLVTLTDRAIVIHDKVHFETAKAIIKPESYHLLRQVARVIIEHPEVLEVSVEGHADSRGGEQYNLDLSSRRARAVHDFLIAQGVSPTRLKSQGFGESRPIVDEDTEDAWAKNRRVEFVITKRADIPDAPE